MNTKNRLLFPALRCRMGNWYYYITYLKFSDIVQWIKPTEEVHQSKKLAEWIQRRLDSKHTESIANYLLTQSERFFNSIVIGVYGGQPQWAPIKVSVPNEIELEQLSDEQEIELESSIGLLKFSGGENLFAIDGQHRVAGIKKAIRGSEELGQEEICAIFVGHENTKEGMECTRRLFTTLNKTAKKVETADIVALDEDDGFAVVTRQLVDEFELFSQGEKVAFTKSPAIPESDHTSITSVIGIYYLTQDLYSQQLGKTFPKKSKILQTRPTDQTLKKIYDDNCKYWLLLAELVPEYKTVFAVNTTTSPSQYRTEEHNHLLFRSIGQRAFASASQVLVDRGRTIKQAIQALNKANLWLNSEEWHFILWNPIQKKMMATNRVAAETFLLRQIGEKGRSKKNDERLNELINRRDQELSSTK